MIKFFDTNFLFHTLRVNEHISITNIELIFPFDEKIRRLAIFWVCIILTEILGNFKQIHTQNTMMLIRKDVEITLVENNIFDIRYLVCLINIHFDTRLSVYIQRVLGRSNNTYGLLLIKYEELRLFCKI